MSLCHDRRHSPPRSKRLQKTVMAYVIRLSNPDVDFTNLLWTPDEWSYKHPLVAENGDAIPATNRLPTRPPELAGNASQTQVTIFTNKVRIADYALAGSAALKDAILKMLNKLQVK